MCEQHAGALELMLTDVVMPRMSGPQLAARLRSIRPELRIINISGYSKDRFDSADGTHDRFLTKPVSIDELLQRVRRVLDH